MMKNPALVVVDMLYDFIDGTLACHNAENAVDETARFIDRMTSGQEGDGNEEILDTYPILFVCDHHPSGHCSFKENGGDWPCHCVQGTHGGQIHEKLMPYVQDGLTFFKGSDPDKEQYSGAEATNSAGQSLADILGLLDTTDVYVCGIATEFCVRSTCEDLLKAGMKVHLLSSALGWVDTQGHRKALAEMASEGIIVE